MSGNVAPLKRVIRRLDRRIQQLDDSRVAYYTCIMASARNGTLNIGMTNNLVRRVWEHKNHTTDGFTDRYGVTRLVWFEAHETADAAIQREKALKRYQRSWKLDLIEAANPDWSDLYNEISR